MERFVLDYGWWYAPCPLPEQVNAGTPRNCFYNAFNLAKDDPSLTYCEGYAIGRAGVRMHHAWVTDGKGSSMDSTWGEAGRAYAGVPFQILFLLERALKNLAVVCALDDWEHDWPLLGDLGDRPDQWLEPTGYGISRLTEPPEDNRPYDDHR